MQIPVARNGLTSDQVTSLIRDAPALRISAGLQLVDINMNTLVDLTGDFQGGTVSRDGYSTLHGSANLLITVPLDWGTAIVRPFITLSDNTVSATFNLGAYLTSTPSTSAEESPQAYNVGGVDILHWLNTPVGEAYVLDTATPYLVAVETIMQTQGITKYLIDQTQAGVLATDTRVWALDTKTTWLNVINDMLGAIGYLGLYSDWNGTLVAAPYLDPLSRAPEWIYATDLTTSMLAPKRTINQDFFNAPNRWVFFWSKDPAGAQPIEGAGIFTYVNDRDGPTSVEARGRTITSPPQQLDAVDQASLVAQAQQIIAADERVKVTIDVSSSPNPLHWHFDRIIVNDAFLGTYADMLVTAWTLPLDGNLMTQRWTQL